MDILPQRHTSSIWQFTLSPMQPILTWNDSIHKRWLTIRLHYWFTANWPLFS